MADGNPFMTLDANKLHENLLDILCQTARQHGRIEISNNDGAACILISKEELDAMEQALEILFKMDSAKSICSQIRRYAMMSLPDSPTPQRDLQIA